MGEGRRELVRGKVIEMSPTGGEHGVTAGRILHYLNAFVLQHDLGDVYASETGFILERDPDMVMAPDAAFIPRERSVPTREFISRTPDLAVEVVSPNDRDAEVTETVRCWLEHGSREVWVADPAGRHVEIHRAGRTAVRLFEKDVIEGGDILPGFTLPVSRCFPSRAHD